MSTDHGASSSAPLDELPTPRGRPGFDLLVFDLVRAIPWGRVMTYGGIAALIPAPSSLDPLAYRRIRARWVGYALANCPDDIPWQRVINSSGKPSQRASGGHLPQAELLAQEGVPFSEPGVVDLGKAAWEINTHEIARIARGLVRGNPAEFHP